jgi:hypothetical protein
MILHFTLTFLIFGVSEIFLELLNIVGFLLDLPSTELLITIHLSFKHVQVPL